MSWQDQGEDLEAARRAKRPRVFAGPKNPGECILAGCHRDAVADPDEPEPVLCPEHKRILRPRCPHCGRQLSDHFAEIAVCGRCYHRARPEERERISELARRRRAAAWWNILTDPEISRDDGGESG